MLASERMYPCLVCCRITAGRVELDGCPPAPACSPECSAVLMIPCLEAEVGAGEEIASPVAQDEVVVENVEPGAARFLEVENGST